MAGRWTWQQDATLRRRYRAGVPRQRVAAALGRSPDTSMPAGGRSASPPTHTAVPGRALPTICSAPPTRRGCHSPRWRGGSAGRPQRSAGDDTCSGCSGAVRTPGRPPRIRSSAASGGEPPSGELWHTGGWVVRTGDDPTGIGHQGLGVLTGCTWAEVTQVPALSAAELLDYLGQVTDRLLQALDGMPTEVCTSPHPAWAAPAAVTRC
jgi:hypothetical protein